MKPCNFISLFVTLFIASLYGQVPRPVYIYLTDFSFEWTFMVLGQSTGAAAVLAIENRKTIQDVEYMKLREILLHERQVLKIYD